jgi:hypothetical protein
MTQEAWTPVAVKGPARLVNLEGGLASLEWDLEGGVVDAWRQVFQPSGRREGSMAYLRCPDPEVRSDNVIRWTVPEPDAVDTHQYVKATVEATNQAFQQWSRGQARAVTAQKSRDEETAARAVDLQEKLNKLEDEEEE